MSKVRYLADAFHEEAANRPASSRVVENKHALCFFQDLASHVKARFLANAFNEANTRSSGYVRPKLQYHQPCVCITSSDADKPGELRDSAPSPLLVP